MSPDMYHFNQSTSHVLEVFHRVQRAERDHRKKFQLGGKRFYSSNPPISPSQTYRRQVSRPSEPSPLASSSPLPYGTRVYVNSRFIMQHQRKQGTKHPKYKTAQCAGYKRDGQCAYGDQCQFLHPDDCKSGAMPQP